MVAASSHPGFLGKKESTKSKERTFGTKDRALQLPRAEVPSAGRSAKILVISRKSQAQHSDLVGVFWF
jgi:hypothetical protein